MFNFDWGSAMDPVGELIVLPQSYSFKGLATSY